MNNNNILILGKGYMGKAIQNRLGCQLQSSKELNYHDPTTLRKFILNNDIKIVINCSGFTGRPNVDEAETKKELCWELNVLSPLRVNRLCNELDVKYIHISSGCIYEGYHSDWSELDKPNFGLFQNHSSFYSKSKHAFEIFSEDLSNIILRIRMPVGHDISGRNYLTKISKYTNLIDYLNSKTYIPDLCEVVYKLCFDNIKLNSREIINVVNPEPLTTGKVCEIMKKYGFHNSNWKFVPLSELGTVANRSNCVLNSEKVNRIHQMLTETEMIEKIYKERKEDSENRRKMELERLENQLYDND
jgi:dTDP-4-dehydrorhamnose reductase